MSQTKDFLHKAYKPFVWVWRAFQRYWRRNWWHKFVTCAFVLAGLTFGGMYGIAYWYQQTQKNKPLQLGVTFIPSYASYLGLDVHQTYNAILDELHVKQLRLVSYWSDIEPTQGSYDFTELDYEMSQAEAHGVKVSLAVGLRQPRWPECHEPSWVDTTKPLSAWEPQLNAYMSAVVNRYKDNPALTSYQLENEYYLNAFGVCHNFDRGRLANELALVKKLDSHHPVIMTRSNNYAGLALRGPLPDIVGISVYRHVWNNVVFHRYLTYPFPSWYYAFLAGAEQIATGKPSLIHELQTEAWPPDGQNITEASPAEQDKTFNAGIFQSTVDFAKQSGIKHIDLWGAEYWYYRAQALHDPSVWDTAKTIFAQGQE
jgi:hypothetical protein